MKRNKTIILVIHNQREWDTMERVLRSSFGLFIKKSGFESTFFPLGLRLSGNGTDAINVGWDNLGYYRKTYESAVFMNVCDIPLEKEKL